MANALRERFDDLAQACQDCRLAQPRIRPGRLGTSWEIEIPGQRSFICKDDPKYGVDSAWLWVQGYRSAFSSLTNPCAEVCDEVAGDPIAEAAILAKRVLDCSGEGGPQDHELLAKAIISLSVAVLERSNAKDRTNSD